jgi:dolichol-phosphate mannosyltransferase
MLDLSICITAHNEDKTIRELVYRLNDLCFHKNIKHQFILCNNNSDDSTGDIMKEMLDSPCLDSNDIKVIEIHGKTLPYMIVYKTIVGIADGSYVFVIDADLQYKPEELWEFWKLRNRYDIINGVKIHRQDPLLRKIESWGFHFVTGLLFRRMFKDPDCGFRLFNKDCIKYVNESRYLSRSPGTEMLIRASKDGKSIYETGVSHIRRMYGSSTVSKSKDLFSVIKEQTIGVIELCMAMLLD